MVEAWFGHKKVVKLLLEQDDVEVNSKSKDNETPLLLAAPKGHKAVVKLLLDKGALLDLSLFVLLCCLFLLLLLGNFK